MAHFVTITETFPLLRQGHHNMIEFYSEKRSQYKAVKKGGKIKNLNSATKKKVIQMQFGIWEFERISSLKYFSVNVHE